MRINFVKYIFWSVLFFISPSLHASSPQYIALADSAEMYLKREKWDAAERVILKALRLEPANFSNSLLLSNLGIAQMNQGRYSSAVESLSLGLSISPNSSTLHNNRARALLYKNLKNEALSDIEESLRIDSIQEWPLQMRGLLLLEKNELIAAEESFFSLLRHFPMNDVGMSGLGKIMELKGKKEDALRYYDEALRLSDDPETRSWRILLKIAMERFSEASDDIKESIGKYPENPYFYIWRGYLHRLRYRNEEAQADKKIAINKGADKQLVDNFIP